MILNKVPYMYIAWFDDAVKNWDAIVIYVTDAGAHCYK